MNYKRIHEEQLEEGGRKANAETSPLASNVLLFIASENRGWMVL